MLKKIEKTINHVNISINEDKIEDIYEYSKKPDDI